MRIGEGEFRIKSICYLINVLFMNSELKLIPKMNYFEKSDKLFFYIYIIMI